MKRLRGLRIVVTRPRHQAGELHDLLRQEGALPLSLPLIAVEAIALCPELDRALDNLDPYDWVVFTSANGVAAFVDRMIARGENPSQIGVKVAAVGPKTQRALAERRVATQFTPDEYRAEAIVEGLGRVEGHRILLPQAERARRELGDGLRLVGAKVDSIAVYRTVPADPAPETVAILSAGVDAITFASPSAVEQFVERFGSTVPGHPVVACLGPVTAETARQLGLEEPLVARDYTVDGLVTTLIQHFARSAGRGVGAEVHRT